MELREAIFNRQSIREFKELGVNKEKILKILEDANQAPSAGNLQARDFIVVSDKNKKAALAKAALMQDFVAKAPAVIVVCANGARSSSKYGKRGRELYSVIDASLAAQNLMLSATEEGLSTCFVGAFDETEVKKILNIPQGISPVGILPIGFSDENPAKTDRFEKEFIVHWEGW